MNRLAVTADDFGLMPCINDGIIALARAGRISSASVMCHDEAALERAPELASCGIRTGIHLVFSGEAGMPCDYRRLFVKTLLKPAALEEVRAAAQKQIARFLSLGLTLDFINSHQYAHLIPHIWRTLQGVFEKHPGTAIRLPRHAPCGLKSSLLYVSSGLCSWISPAKGRRILSPFGIDQAGGMVAKHAGALLERISQTTLPAGCTAELVMHPGLENAELKTRYAAWHYNWRAEYDLLMSEAFQDMLVKMGLQYDRD